ncbi:MAG TPA: type II toxin-antitoxin system VapC family toxin [Terriglobales bacterium]|jgi:PIN domain nuclease of toxin-antitoxin system|nr:type II toxin-antitoxin system VapC family toxin [Terriglobales bacterium]
MRILLDTHIWLWSVGEPQRLRSRAASEMEDPRNELWLSPISIWEIQMLSAKRRISLGMDVDTWITRALRSWPLREATVTHEVAQELGKLQLGHRDLADHFLVATAKVFDLILATRDELLLDTKEIEVLPA